jgi:outer membrane usher protein
MRGGAVARGRGSFQALLALALALVAAPAAADPDAGADPTADELARVFENYHRAERALVALVIDGVEAATDGPIVLELGRPGSPPSVPAAPVLAALAPRLRPEAGDALREAVRGHRLSLEAMRAGGLAVAYDARQLELRIDVPPRLTRAVSHDLGATMPPEARDALGPAGTSGYVNLRAQGTTDSALDLQSDAAINLDRWVLQGRADATRTPGPRAAVTGHRGDVLLVRDLPGSAVRFMAGDFAVTPSVLQASYPLLGVTAGRDFSLQPYRVLRPVGSFDFVLERAARVTVLVNGVPVHTLSLPAGRHDVRDLPLAATVNDIELVIRDGTGGERRIAFSMASPDALLAPGLVQFSLSGGVPLLSDAGMRSYELARPVGSGRLRAGVTQRLTLGGALDGDRDLQVGSVAATVATRLGRLSLDIATSRARALGDGTAAARAARRRRWRSPGTATRGGSGPWGRRRSTARPSEISGSPPTGSWAPGCSAASTCATTSAAAFATGSRSCSVCRAVSAAWASTPA